MPTVSAADLIDFTARLFEAAGVPGDESRTVATSLVGANLRGHDSHGVMRVAQYMGFLEKKLYRTGVPLLVENETPASVACDAQWGFGQVQAHRLLDLIVPKAKALGVAAGTARRCGHVGRLGEYAERALESGLLLIASVNNDGSGQRVAPPGGLEPRLGTNPLCVGVPSGAEDRPIVLDFGTSVAAEGKVRVHYIADKRPVPEGWLQDHEGRPTTDPSVLYEPPIGSILPMGGTQAYKGFGLALVLDILTGGLSGGRTCHPGSPMVQGNNLLLLALDPAHFGGRGKLIEEAAGLVAHVRNTPTAPTVDAILLPGDPERLTMERRTAQGIPLDESHWARLTELAERLGVNPP